MVFNGIELGVKKDMLRQDGRSEEGGAALVEGSKCGK